MKRVAIIGSGGSGKSRLARELGERTGLPVIHLDQLFWKPGWVETPEDEWRALHERLIAQDRWIIDGNYGGTMERRVAVADTVVFMDIPRLVCLWSVVKRRFREGRRGRPDMPPGLADQLDGAFLSWIWNYPKTRRPGVLAMLAALPSTTTVVHLRSRAAARAWLQAVA